MCVNEDDAGDSDIVPALPIVSEPTVGVVLLGIVGSVTVIDPLAVPYVEAIEKLPLKDKVNCFVPSELCATVKSPYAADLVEALSVSTVMYFLFSALEYAVSYCVVKSVLVGTLEGAKPRFSLSYTKLPPAYILNSPRVSPVWLFQYVQYFVPVTVARYA